MPSLTRELADSLERGVLDLASALRNLKIYEFGQQDLERQLEWIEKELAGIASRLGEVRVVLDRTRMNVHALARGFDHEVAAAEQAFSRMEKTLSALRERVLEEVKEWRKRQKPGR